jgi:hypothetical protein
LTAPDFLDLPLGLPRTLGFADISAGLLLQLNHAIHNPVVEIFTSEIGVSSCGEDFEYTVVDGKKR